jgi:hypothetical protein
MQLTAQQDVNLSRFLCSHTIPHCQHSRLDPCADCLIFAQFGFRIGILYAAQLLSVKDLHISAAQQLLQDGCVDSLWNCWAIKIENSNGGNTTKITHRLRKVPSKPSLSEPGQVATRNSRRRLAGIHDLCIMATDIMPIMPNNQFQSQKLAGLCHPDT